MSIDQLSRECVNASLEHGWNKDVWIHGVKTKIMLLLKDYMVPHKPCWTMLPSMIFVFATIYYIYLFIDLYCTNINPEKEIFICALH